MDTRTRTASPATEGGFTKHATPPPVQDKISAYYSLVFPHYTFYIQTLSITIGRRCAPNAATSSTAPPSQVDVDLGALKSVSRLHAKIEYDQDEDRFVLIVIGRNGAWVDGVWSGAGTRAPLGERCLSLPLCSKNYAKRSILGHKYKSLHEHSISSFRPRHRQKTLLLLAPSHQQTDNGHHLLILLPSMLHLYHRLHRSHPTPLPLHWKLNYSHLRPRLLLNLLLNQNFLLHLNQSLNRR